MDHRDEPLKAEEPRVQGRVAAGIVVFAVVLVFLDAVGVAWPLTGVAALALALAASALVRWLARRARRRRAEDAKDAGSGA
jgi:Flp pilus assembly protein TadB